MSNSTKVKFLILTGVIMALTSYSGQLSFAAAENTAPHADKDAKICHLKIEGMTCSMCEMMIKKSIKDVALSADIDSKAGTGKVTYAQGKTTCSEISDKITKSGFKSNVVE